MKNFDEKVEKIDMYAKQLINDFNQRYELDEHWELKLHGCIYYRDTEATPMMVTMHLPVEETDAEYSLETRGHFFTVSEKIIDDEHYKRFVVGMVPNDEWLLEIIHLEKRAFKEQDSMPASGPWNIGIEQAVKVKILKADLRAILMLTDFPLELIGMEICRFAYHLIDDIEKDETLDDREKKKQIKVYQAMIRDLKSNGLYKIGLHFKSFRENG